MSSFASSSRSVLVRPNPLRTVSHVARRTFASTSRTQRELSFQFANLTAVFRLPALPSWLSAGESNVKAYPALAGIGGTDSRRMLETGEEGERASASALEWDGVLNAVPKSKVSHSRKAMRSANKGLKDRVNFVHCPGCGQPKLSHHICASCYGVISRAQKAVARQASQAAATEETKEV